MRPDYIPPQPPPAADPPPAPLASEAPLPAEQAAATDPADGLPGLMVPPGGGR
jgi:phospholipid/cholesterol/gamma-HCH transport system substrate-binding protein